MPVNESNTIQYTVNTSRVPDGTTLYWKTTGNTTNSDIVGGNTGSITITNNQAIFNITIAADETADNVKTLGIALLTGSLNGTQVTTTAAPIVINDTSNTAPPAYVIYSWGRNNNGQLGQNDTVSRSSPTQVGSQTGWSPLSGRLSADGTYRSNMAIKTDGTLWAWGVNWTGSLGTNDTVYRSSPTQVGTNTNWSQVDTKAVNTIATKTDGTLWTWGRNNDGQLGLGNNVNKSSPTQVGTATNWDKVAAGLHSMATKTDGTLWAWGNNFYGTLGQNDTTYRNSPIQVGTATNWSLVTIGETHTTAIKTDGTLWSWGDSNNGQLGQNNTVNKSSPTQIGIATNWNKVSSATTHNMAIKTDGTLWLWGFGSGMLAFNDDTINNRSSPTQVGTNTNWSQVSAGKNHSTAIKTNGTLWAWGRSAEHGNLGLNERVNKSSPTQIGVAANWSLVSAGQYNSVAIASN
jgi:alpha-tubulin suppressor-like RCC1 family protein